jgi:toxin ParE1/3/4
VKTYRIVWSAPAQDRFLALYEWIADHAGKAVADDYADALVTHVAKLSTFPERGTPRNDLRPGIRTIPYRRRTIIAYRVLDDEVEISALVHGGQTFEGTFDA